MSWRQQHDDNNPTVELKRLLDEALGPLERSVETLSVEESEPSTSTNREKSVGKGEGEGEGEGKGNNSKISASPKERERQRAVPPVVCWRALSHTLELVAVSAALATVGNGLVRVG